MVYHDHFTERVEDILETMTDAEIDAMYANHNFAEDSFYEIEPGIFLFGSVEQIEGDMEINTGDYYQNTLPPTYGPIISQNIGCNITSNKADPVYEDNWNGGFRVIRKIPMATRRRMKVKAWSTNYLTHATGGFQTIYQRKVAGLWWRKKAERISVSARATAYYPLPASASGEISYVPFELDY